MSEAEILELLTEGTANVLGLVSIYFTVVSAYVVAVWAFLRHAGFGLRVFSFFFLTLVVAFLARVAHGSQQIHDGFVATLVELDRTVGLSPTGDAALNNALSGLDGVIQQSMFFAVIVVYIALFFLTFFARSTLKNA